MEKLNVDKLGAALDYIEQWLQYNFDDSLLTGMQVAIQHEDKLVFSKAYGYADIENKQKLTTDHTFRVASHSKTFTATALMQLKEQGKLNLDDPLSKHITWFKSSKDPRVAEVTIRQLMNHTAGIIRDGEDSNYWQLTRSFPEENELKQYIKTAKLIYDSDEQFKYSNFGYGYLGSVIHAVSGLTYNDYVQKYIIEPLRLTSTSPEYKVGMPLAWGYGARIFNKEPRKFDHADTKALSPATGVCSNAEDLCKYFTGHFFGNGKLLADASKRAMQHGYWQGDETENYGLGMVDYKKEGWRLNGHSGGFPGFITDTQFDPKKKLVISVLINCNDGQPGRVVQGIIGIIDKFQNEYDKKKAVKLQKYAGRFFSIWSAIDIVPMGSGLYGMYPGSWGNFKWASQLKVVDENTLKIEKASGYYSPGELVKFSYDDSGQAKEITFAGTRMLKWEDAKKAGLF